VARHVFKTELWIAMKRRRQFRKRNRGNDWRAIAGGWGGNRLSTGLLYRKSVADLYRVPRHWLSPPAKTGGFFLLEPGRAFSGGRGYDTQATIARTTSWPKLVANVTNSVPAPTTRAISLSVIIVKSPLN
jgi:hypothetical protein